MSLELEPTTPDWVRDAVFYQIFPDRFARSSSVPKPKHLDAWGATPTPHGYQGGDLVGVAENLDYLSDLGVNAIYFTPIFQSASNHRYHTHDYHRVDPMLGGNEALRSLLNQAHARGIRVVLDGVFNHASRGFFQFHDILENGPNSAYQDWFHVHKYPLNAYEPGRELGYAAWWNLPPLPKFNTSTPAVREFLFGVAQTWLDFGVDGWRLDVPNEIDDDAFWREFRHRVKSANPDAYVVGEVWTAADRWLKGDMWDAVMNYVFTKACISFMIGESVNLEDLQKTSLHPAGEPGAEAFQKAIERLQSLYHPNISAVMLNLLGSHDMARFVTLANGDDTALKLATLFQMTYPGAPSIYYGDEIGLAGAHDPANRGAFPWDQASWDSALLQEFQRLIALRKSRTSLRRGDYRSLLARDMVHVHSRALDQDVVIVAINASRQTKVVDIPVAGLLAEGAVLSEAWAKTVVKVHDGQIRQVRLSPRSGRVFLTSLPT